MFEGIMQARSQGVPEGAPPEIVFALHLNFIRLVLRLGQQSADCDGQELILIG